MRKLAAAFSQDVTEEKLAVYADSLRDMSVGRLDLAMARCLKTCKFFPSIAEIRTAADGESETLQLEAEVAWKYVQWVTKTFWVTPDGNIQPISASREPQQLQMESRPFRGGFLVYPKPFDAATDHAIANAGGLYRLSTLTFEEHDFVRRDFLKAHRYHGETLGLLAPSRHNAAVLVQDLFAQKKLNEAGK
jgi:hypothetical protein